MDLMVAGNPAVKGAIPECLDEISTRPNARELMENLKKAIEGIAALDFHGLQVAFEKLLFQQIYPPSISVDKLTDYLKRHWFDAASNEAYFPDLQPIAPVYAAGVVKTLELSLQGAPDPIPIDAWWLLGHHTIEMINLVTSRQVTLLIATPRPPISRKFRRILSDKTEAWSTGRTGITTRKIESRPR